MKSIDRKTAINKITHSEINKLSPEERESLILNWWGLDENDEAFGNLPISLQDHMTNNEDPPSDPGNKIYDELILIAINEKYKGTTNDYISEKLKIYEIGDYTVSGTVEHLETCPCCGYRTLNSISDYEICDLCNWEDTGITDLNAYSGPNHMTLGDAKKIFEQKAIKLNLKKWEKY